MKHVTGKPDPFVVRAADAALSTPLVFDSPHSHAEWPQDIRTIAPPEAIASSCDMFVDEIWSQATGGEVPLLAARFHRAYIDANRPRDDIDGTLLDAPWPEPAHPRSTSERGMGLIRRLALPGVPMYDRPLALRDVQDRIAHCYDPYHAELDRLVSAAVGRFGLAVHVNCHSMKSVGNAMNIDEGSPRPDMVVSDLGGTTAAGMLVRWIVGCLRGMGYRVLVNHPYQGGEIVRRHARPHEGRHSVQIEINRALYMDERRFEKHAGFARLVDDLAVLVRQLRRGLGEEPAPSFTPLTPHFTRP